MQTTLLAALLTAGFVFAGPNDNQTTSNNQEVKKGDNPVVVNEKAGGDGVVSDVYKIAEVMDGLRKSDETVYNTAGLSDDQKVTKAREMRLATRQHFESLYGRDIVDRAYQGFKAGLDSMNGEETQSNRESRDNRQGNNNKEKEKEKDRNNEFIRGLLNDGKELYPERPDYYAASGKEHLRQRQFGDAAKDLSKAISMGDRSEDTFAAYGSAAHNLGDFRTAAEASAMALKFNPSNRTAVAVYKLSQGRVPTVNLPSAFGPDQGERGDAGGSRGSSVEFQSGGPRPSATPQAAQAPGTLQKSLVLTRQAASALNVRDYTSARSLATEAVSTNPRNAQAWNYRAIADNKLQLFQDAVRDASYSLALAPGNAPGLQSRAWAYNKLKQHKEALADVNSVLEQNPDDPFAYQNRAFALAGMGERGAMLEALRRSAELDPRFRERYERALQSPESSDVMFLFDDAPAEKADLASGVSRPPKKNRFLFMSFNVLMGGCLVALGLLHIFSPNWRERVGATARRLAGPPAHSVAAGDTPAGISSSSGFWAQYELVRELGTGGMGIVYEATDRTLERPVAIKRMRDEIRLDPHERSRFMSEAKTVATLHHPNIVDIYSIVEDSGEVYLVFEYVEGRTLAELLRERGSLGFEEARQLFRGACEAVGHAHRQKVIHRDLKPSNIMVSENGAAKVMDFGVARQAKDAVTKHSQLMTNTVVGTPPYMAPEQEQGTVRVESDVYSLGIVFYEMLSGQLPFQGHGAGMLLNKINGKHIPLSSLVQSGLPKALDQVLAKALHPDPEKRYRTPAELLSAVDSLALGKMG